MRKIPPQLLAAFIVLGLIYVAYCSGQHEGARTALAEQRDKRDDSTVVLLRREAADSQKAFSARQDSTGRVIRQLQQRIAGQVVASHRCNIGGEGLCGIGPEVKRQPGLVTESPRRTMPAPDLRDSLIAALTVGRQQDSLQLLFWKAQVDQRDSVISTLQASRNAWRGQSQKRFACVGGATAAIGFSGQSALGVGVTCGIRI